MASPAFVATCATFLGLPRHQVPGARRLHQNHSVVVVEAGGPDAGVRKARLHPSEGARERSFLAASSLRWLRAVLGILRRAALISACVCTWRSPRCLCVFSLLVPRQAELPHAQRRRNGHFVRVPACGGPYCHLLAERRLCPRARGRSGSP